MNEDQIAQDLAHEILSHTLSEVGDVNELAEIIAKRLKKLLNQ